MHGAYVYGDTSTRPHELQSVVIHVIIDLVPLIANAPRGTHARRSISTAMQRGTHARTAADARSTRERVPLTGIVYCCTVYDTVCVFE